MVWRNALMQEARTAGGQGELAPGTDPDQLAFELVTMLAGADIVSVLHDDAAAIERARTAIQRLLTPVGTGRPLPMEPPRN